MGMLVSIRCRFVSESMCAPQSPLLHHSVSSLEGTPLLIAACELQTARRCLLPVSFCLFGSHECQVCAMTGFLFPLVLGTSRSQRDAEQTNRPPFPKVTSCFPTHLQRHFPSPGLAGSSSLCQKGGRGRCCSSQSSQRARQRFVSPREASRGGGSSWVRSPCVPLQMQLLVPLDLSLFSSFSSSYSSAVSFSFHLFGCNCFAGPT